MGRWTCQVARKLTWKKRAHTHTTRAPMHTLLHKARALVVLLIAFANVHWGPVHANSSTHACPCVSAQLLTRLRSVCEMSCAGGQRSRDSETNCIPRPLRLRRKMHNEEKHLSTMELSSRNSQYNNGTVRG